MAGSRILSLSASMLILLMLVLSSLPLFRISDPEAMIPKGPGSFLEVSVDNDYRIWGDIDNATFGTSVASGDLDGDGYDDIAIGVPESDYGRGAGAVLLYFARDREELEPSYGFRDADTVIEGINSGDRFGYAVEIEDLDGDGRAELVASAPYGDGPGNNRRDTGDVYIVQGVGRESYGHLNAIENMSAWGVVYGRDAGDHLGVRIEFGDLDDNGTIDLIFCSEGSGGTGDCRPEGGTNAGSPYAENGIVGSWEIEVLCRQAGPLGTLDIGTNFNVTYRWYGADVRREVEVARHVGNGIAVGDFDGDNIDDMLFSYYLGSDGFIVMAKGGTGFPYLPTGNYDKSFVFPEPPAPATTNPHPMFYPNLTISLGTAGHDQALLRLGDANGDGTKDLLAGLSGAPGKDAYRLRAGQTDLYIGKPITVDNIDRSGAVWTFYGTDAGDRMGSSLAMIDRDSDGIDEIFVGSPFSDGIDNERDGAGELFGFYRNGVFPRTSIEIDADMMLQGKAGYATATELAWSDMDDNGFPELIVSSPGARSPAGVGKGLVTLTGFDGSFEAGFSTSLNVSSYGDVVCTSDFDNDGNPDILIGSGFDNSQLQPFDLYFSDGTPWSGNYMDGRRNVRYFADFFIGAADLDSDGYDDIVLSTREGGASGNPGYVRIYWGGTQAAMEQSSSSSLNGYDNAEFGWAMGAGDINGDGITDLAISAHLATSGPDADRFKSGTVHVWYGPIGRGSFSASSSDLEIFGAVTNDQIGSAILISDFNGDGNGEIVIGSPLTEPGSVHDQGSVTVIRGSAALPSQIDLANYPVLRIDGEWAYDNLGSSVRSADVVGDSSPDLIMAAVGNDGFEKKVSNSGAVYLLSGAVISSLMDGSVKQLRKGSDLTIYGSQENEMFGSGLCIADTDGDAKNEMIVGSPNWVHTDTGQIRGAVSFVLGPETMLGKIVNSSDLPKVLGPSNSGFGMSVDANDFNADPKDDLLIGAPSYDPDEDGVPQGGAFIWFSKSLLPRSIKVRPVQYLNSEVDPSEDRTFGRTPILSPMEGPYVLRVSSITEFGIPTVSEIGVRIVTSGGSETDMRYYTSNGTFHQTSDTDLLGKLRMQAQSCKAWDDGGINIRADFAVTPSWDMADPTLIVTYVKSSSGEAMNYRSALFAVDRSLSVTNHELFVQGEADPTIWLNSTTQFGVKNVTVVHSRTTKSLSGPALDSLHFSLRRHDGFKIGTGERSGNLLTFGPTTVGANVTGSDLSFKIALDDAIDGLSWNDEPVLVKADTYAPPAVGTFKVVNDGQEGGYDPLEDDPYVEVFWTDVRDNGDSGVAKYRFHMISESLGTHVIRDDISSHQIVIIPQGDVRLGLQAIDQARNEGPIEFFDIMSDLTEPIFHSETPQENSWLKDGSMTVRVQVDDNASGLDISTAQVRYYIAQTNFLSSWLTATALMGVDGSTTLSYDMPRVEGILNYVQWCITDRSGTESVSRPYYYNVDLTLPKIEGDESIHWINGERINFTTVIIDALSGLDLSSVSYKFGPQTDFFKMDYTSLGYKGFGAAAYPSIEIEPDFTGWAYLQWRAQDRAGNTAESPIIVYYIDLKMPILDTILPASGTVLGSRAVTVTVSALDLESGITFEGMEYSMSNTTIWVEYGIGGYTPWANMDRLTETGAGYYEGVVNLTFDQGEFNFIKLRLKDRAGNGWVESAPHRISVSTRQANMPPVAKFDVIPFVDEIYQGEIIRLDGSASYDPESHDLTYRWFSDIETYPAVSLLGNRSIVDVKLNTTGVQRIWLEVSDGKATARSQEIRVRVLPVKPVDDGTEGSIDKDLSDYLAFLLLAMLVGLIIGIVGAYSYLRKRKEEPQLPPPILEDARMEVDYHPIKCPYCKSEVRTTDTYCMKCGTVFTPEDLETMRTIDAGKPAKKKKTRIELQQPSDESILPPSLEGEPIFMEGAKDGDIEHPVEADEDISEFEDMEEFEDDEEEEDWEVRS